jgi:hypothetical protein
MRRGLLLKISSFGHYGERVLVDRDRFVIGRERDCDLPIDHMTMARRHAVLARAGDGWTIADAGSTGGIVLDGNRLDGIRELVPGMRFELGQHAFQVVELDHATDDITPRIDRVVRIACGGVTCTAELRFASLTSTPAVDRWLDALLAPLAGDVGDPVAVVLALQATCAHFVQPVHGIGVAVHVDAIHVDANALALLREDAEPARAAWVAFRHRYLSDLVTPDDVVVGISHVRREVEGLIAPPIELVRAAGTGRLVWLRDNWLGQLLRIERATHLRQKVHDFVETRGLDTEITPVPEGFVIDDAIENSDVTVRTGQTIQLRHQLVLALR